MLTAFRNALMDQLATALGVEVVAGIINQPLEDRSIACVWIASVGEVSDAVQLETIDARIRVFRQWKQQSTIDMAEDDVAALETLAETLQTTLKTIQTTAGPWMFRVTGVELDLGSMGVEAAVLATHENLFTQ